MILKFNLGLEFETLVKSRNSAIMKQWLKFETVVKIKKSKQSTKQMDPWSCQNWTNYSENMHAGASIVFKYVESSYTKTSH